MIDLSNIERRSREAIEWAAVDHENGFRHLRADTELPDGGAHGLFPRWDGVSISRRTKEGR